MSDMESGYTDCACRDCFEIAISDDITKPDYCNMCEGKCGPEYATSGDCQVEAE